MIENKYAGMTGIVRRFETILMTDTPKYQTNLCPKPTNGIDHIAPLLFSKKGSYNYKRQ
jgi:hypothetical protein